MFFRNFLMILGLVAVCMSSSVTSAQQERPSHWGAYSVDLVDETGIVLPTFEHRGRTYVLGALEVRYFIRVRNQSSSRTEVVASVDGRDVLDGRPANAHKRGYIIDPYGEVRIDGYRLDDSSVAAFRFSSVPRSYSAQMGDARDVGVIGVAVFPERRRPPPFVVAKKEGSPPRSAAADRAFNAPSSAPASSPQMKCEERSGLGTEFGERHDSQVYHTSFERARSQPDTILTLRYNDRQGLMALGIDVDGRSHSESWRRETATPFRQNRYSKPPPGWGP